MSSLSFKCEVSLFRVKALSWASEFEYYTYLTNNGISYTIPTFVEVLAVGADQIFKPSSTDVFKDLQNWYEAECYNKSWAFGYFSYDLKNKIEDLQTSKKDKLNFPELFFYIPQHLIFFKEDEVLIEAEFPEEIFSAIQSFNPSMQQLSPIKLNHGISKEKYLETVNKLKRHIVEGDIYEVNYCIDFYAENVNLNPLAVYLDLNEISPMPFSCFHRNKEAHLISASPERFLKKEGSKIIAQPIKGTASRGKTKDEDKEIKDELYYSEKERSENVMIVDLMRNDLSKSCIPGSVQVEELFSVYTFSQVHQMISTVTGQLDIGIHPIDTIKNTFPMGSMTGAPKIRAMQLIDEYESSARGLFSGAIGYLNPNRDFDFNVIIRSILYNSGSKYLSFKVGSAITAEADPKREYEECLLKARAMMQVLEGF